MINYIAIGLACFSIILNLINFYKDSKFRKDIMIINHDINSIVKDTDNIKGNTNSYIENADNRLNEIENALKSRGFMHK